MAEAIPTNDIKFVAAILYRVYSRTSNLEPRTSNLEPRTSNLEPSYVGVMLAWRAKQVSRLRLIVLHRCGVLELMAKAIPTNASDLYRVYSRISYLSPRISYLTSLTSHLAPRISHLEPSS